MQPITTVSFIGMGSLGSAYASKMAESIPARDIRMVASGERAERYRRCGVRVNGREFRFSVCDPTEKVEPADLMVFAVKNHHLAQSMKDARNHIGPGTVIISLLNGITSEKVIGDAFGHDKVLYAYSVKVDATRSGNDVTYTKLGLIPFGEAVNKPGHLSEKVRRVQAFFERSGIDYIIPEDMVRSLWIKFMLNVGINQVSAILRAPYGPFQKPGEPRDLVLAAMMEVVELSSKEGVNLTAEDALETITAIDALSPDGKTSMRQDIDAGQKTEVESFGGTVVELAKKHGLAVPVNTMLVRLLCALESIHKAG